MQPGDFNGGGCVRGGQGRRGERATLATANLGASGPFIAACLAARAGTQDHAQGQRDPCA